MTFGNRLTQRRTLLALSQAELSRRSGVAQALISRMESGQIQEPGMSTIRSLATALGVTSDYLIGMCDEASTLDHTSTPVAV